MSNEPVFLTADEASSLQAAVGRIVSSGIKVQDAELQLPADRETVAEKPPVIPPEEAPAPNSPPI